MVPAFGEHARIVGTAVGDEVTGGQDAFYGDRHGIFFSLKRSLSNFSRVGWSSTHSESMREIDMADGLNRFLGDTPMRTIVKLAILCLVVGFIMSTFGLHPMDILYWIRKTFLDLWHSGFATLGKVGNYILLGAAIVIPLFIVLRILNWRKS
jgi:hypothetical protein